MPDQTENAAQKPAWAPPEGAVSVLMWTMLPKYGYFFLSEPLVKVGERVFEGKLDSGLKLLLIGVDFIERTLTFREKSFDDALWGIHKTADFNGQLYEKNKVTSAKYFIRFAFEGTLHDYYDDAPPIMTDENTVRINAWGNEINLHCKDIQVLCCQIRPDDSGKFDLSELPEFDNDSPVDAPRQ